MERFEVDLYEAVCDAFPGTTVRSMSCLLGRSVGYWSSITAQELPVSNAALAHLTDSVATRLMVVSADSPRYAHLLRLNRLVREQLLERLSLVLDTAECTDHQDIDVSSYGVLPISVMIY